MLQRHDWPGNVRELQHAIERAVILSGGPVLQQSHFRDPDAAPRSARTPVSQPHDGEEGVRLDTLDLSEAEALLIERALKVTGGNRTRAATLLGISVRTLRNKLNAARIAAR